MFRKLLWVSVAFTGVLVTSCGGGVGTNEPLSSSEKHLRPGPAVEFADSKGYKFRAEALSAGKMPEVGDGISEAKSAPPGETFIYVDLLVTNLQTDRTAPLTDFLENWYIQVPGQFYPNPDRSLFSFCDDALSNFCGSRVSCLHADTNRANVISGLGGFNDKVRTMPAGAVWRLGCVLGADPFGAVSEAEEISDSIKPPDIHFVRIVREGPLKNSVKERQEIKIPAV